MDKNCAVCIRETEENSIAWDMIKEYDKKLKKRSILCVILFVLWMTTIWHFAFNNTKNNYEEYTECKIIAPDIEKKNISAPKQKKRKTDTVKLRLVTREIR